MSGTRQTKYSAVHSDKHISIKSSYNQADMISFHPGSSVMHGKASLQVKSSALFDMSGKVKHSKEKTFLRAGGEKKQSEDLENGPDLFAVAFSDIQLVKDLPRTASTNISPLKSKLLQPLHAIVEKVAKPKHKRELLEISRDQVLHKLKTLEFADRSIVDETLADIISQNPSTAIPTIIEHVEDLKSTSIITDSNLKVIVPFLNSIALSGNEEAQIYLGNVFLSSIITVNFFE